MMEHLENDWSGVRAARTRAAVDVWPGLLAAVLILDESRALQCSLSKPGGSLLLMERGAKAQAGHNGFGVRDGVSPEYLFTVTGEVSAHCCVTPGLCLHVHCGTAQKKVLSEAFLMDELEVPLTSDFAGPGYVQHSGSKWRGDHCNLYHSYLFLENHSLPDAIEFAYDDSTALGSKRAPVSSGRILDQQEGASEGDVEMGDRSNMGLDSKESEWELYAFML